MASTVKGISANGNRGESESGKKIAMPWERDGNFPSSVKRL